MNSLKIKQLASTVLGLFLPLEYIFELSHNRYVLAYHRVLPINVVRQFSMQASMWISVDTFNDDIIWMKAHGDIVDLDTILDFNTLNKKPLFSITFDDGWADNYEYAFPILKQHNVPATIFLVTSAIETSHLFWVEDFLYKVAQLTEEKPVEAINSVLANYYSKAGDKQPSITDTKLLAEGFAELLKPLSRTTRSALLRDIYRELGLDSEPINDQILRWPNIIEMSEWGIEFGSHTHTHEILQYAGNDIIAKELMLSKSLITEKLGKPVRYFCYPNARYRNDNADLIEQAGYEYAFRIHNLCVNKNQSRYFIPRYLLNERTSYNKKYLVCKLLNLPKF